MEPKEKKSSLLTKVWRLIKACFGKGEKGQTLNSCVLCDVPVSDDNLQNILMFAGGTKPELKEYKLVSKSFEQNVEEILNAKTENDEFKKYKKNLKDNQDRLEKEQNTLSEEDGKKVEDWKKKNKYGEDMEKLELLSYCLRIYNETMNEKIGTRHAVYEFEKECEDTLDLMIRDFIKGGFKKIYSEYTCVVLNGFSMDKNISFEDFQKKVFPELKEIKAMDVYRILDLSVYFGKNPSRHIKEVGTVRLTDCGINTYEFVIPFNRVRKLEVGGCCGDVFGPKKYVVRDGEKKREIEQQGSYRRL